MRKTILWIGVLVFVLAVVCFFLSGSTSGPSPEEASPTVPFLYGTNQFLWIALGVIGIIAAVVGIMLKKKE
jgi:uncharacterized membrane protein YbaN (DUF454 family)